MNRLALIIILLGIFSVTISAQDAQNTSYFVNQVIGEPIADNTSFFVTNDKYKVAGYWESIDTFMYIDNRIIFKIEEMIDSTEQVDIQYVATIQVDYWTAEDDPNGYPSGGFTKDLVIDYKVDSTGRSPISAFVRFEGAQKMEIEVLRIEVNGDHPPAVTPRMRMIGEITTKKNNNFDCFTPPVPTYTEINNPAIADLRHRIQWDEIDGATTYDLEYVFYHIESKVGQEIFNNVTTVYNNYDFLFKNNATRVTTANLEYFLSDAYPEGYLFYRVRAGRKNANGSFQYTRWSNSGETGTIEDFSDRITLDWYEGDFNWQFSSNFAEEGKRVMSINYFDGTQRQRQSRTRFGQKEVFGVTGSLVRDGSERILAQQSIYDQHGRAVIQTLPSPKENASEGLEYIPLLAESSINPGEPYSKIDFLNADCAPDPEPMANTNGVGKYYSPNSTEAPDATPDAEGYPFSIVEFTPDATGRIRRQSGVGPTLMLGSGHESRFFYGKPSQNELDRLFGNNVGFARHYEKNMVIDPNGQVSVSYLDAHGRTIATALAGQRPINVAALEEPEYDQSVTTVYDLLDDIRDNSTLIAYASLTVPQVEDYQIDYLLENIPWFTSGCTTNEICYECKYDVVIEISDDCGNAFANNNGEPLIVKLTNYTPGAIEGVECTLITNNDISHTEAIISLPVGEYKITKRLMLSQEALDGYLANYIEHLVNDSATEPCLPSLEDLVMEYQDAIDISTCEDDICKYQGTTLINFTRELLGIPFPIIPTQEELDAATPLYQELQANIEQFCNLNDPCQRFEQLLYADLVPGGQYALVDFDEVSEEYSTANYPLSILNTSNTFNYTSFDYFSDGVPILVNSSNHPNPVSPKELSLEEFIALFDPSWLPSMTAAFHPEWCLVDEFCANSPSRAYDKALLEEDSYYDAVNSNIGTGSPLINALGEFNWMDGGSQAGDPFFMTGAPGANDRQSIIDYMDDITEGSVLPKSAVELVVEQVYGAGGILGQGPAYADDQAWNLLRIIYMSKKREYVRDVVLAQIIKGNACTSVDQNLIDLYIDEDLIIDNSDPANPVYATIRVYFPFPDNLVYDLDVTTQQELDDLIAQFSDEFDQEIEERCEISCQYTIDNILAELDATCSTMTMGQRDDLEGALLKICIAGCDETHPFGASSPNPNYEGGAPPYNSFAEAIAAILGDENPCTDCTPYVNSGLPPYDRLPYFGPPTTQFVYPPDSVSCWTDNYNYITGILSQTYTGAQLDTALLAYFNGYPDAMLTPEEYATLPYMTPEQLLAIQQSVAVNGDLLLPIPVSIPPQLECDVCITCDTLRALEMSAPDCSGLLLAEQQEVHAQYYNYRLGWDLTAEEYVRFLALCEKPELAESPFETVGLLCPDSDFPTGTPDDGCLDQLMVQAYQQAVLDYNEQLEIFEQEFVNNYLTTCLNGLQETFTAEGSYNEYHYTLYYYDQAGNLIQTVPPAGVSRLDDMEVAAVEAHRLDPVNAAVYPQHEMITTYAYNSLNEVIQKTSPDLDVPVNTWYDRLGRVAISQDGRQAPDNLYSYTIYDYLGRVVEVGEKRSTEQMSRPIVLNPEDLADWIADGSPDTKTHVTRTYYNSYVTTIPGINLMGDILRNRVASVSFEEVNDDLDDTYDYATHYQYDIAGNVELMVQDFPKLENTGNRYKTVAYEYDLISGNVHAVIYQEEQSDQFAHRYEYDDENRLTDVYTSFTETMHSNSTLWDRDAAYTYYPHGPLQRVELGEDMVQGCDYAYTIQGWIKGMNTNNITNPDFDLGNDGKGAISVGEGSGLALDSPVGGGSNVAKDVFGYTLNYFEHDYMPIGGTSLEMPYDNSPIAIASPSLYNGNIRHMVTSYDVFKGNPRAYLYQYDQLHRLLGQTVFQLTTSSTYNWQNNTTSLGEQYSTLYRYDPNGNITSLERYANAGGATTLMDPLDYSYQPLADGRRTNRLSSVSDYSDGIANSSYEGDFEGASDYVYDGAGNLVNEKNIFMGIDNHILWSPYGKVLKVDNANDQSITTFDYDASQNRVRKRFTNSDGKTNDTYYVRDAQGNTLATYVHDHTTNELRWREQHLYGSSRLGLWNANKIVGEGEPVDPQGPTIDPPLTFLATGTIADEDFETIDPFTDPNGIWEKDLTFPGPGGAWADNHPDLVCSGIGGIFTNFQTGSGQMRTIRTRSTLDVSTAELLKLQFCFSTNLNDIGDEFRLEISYDDGATYQVVPSGVWRFGQEYDLPLEDPAGVYTSFPAEVVIDGPFTADTRLRFFIDPVINGRVFFDDMKLEEGIPDHCNDGILNGDEEGIDCGGIHCEPCYVYDNSEFMASTTIYSSDFETVDPLTDPAGVWENDPTFPGPGALWVTGDPDGACSGSGSIGGNYRSSTGEMRTFRTRSTLDLSTAENLRLQFCFSTNMNDPGDEFRLEISYDGGLTYQGVTNGAWRFQEDFDLPVKTGTVFTNFQAQVIIPGPFTSTTRFRFFFDPVDAGKVYFDDMTVEAGTLNLCNDGIQNGDETGIDCGGSQCDDCPETFVRGDKRYELTNHLGNVMAVISDRRFSLTGDEEDPRYRAYTINASEYYPFGLEMENRTFNFGDYRFGFNGKEADTDGEWGTNDFTNTTYDYGFRIYNPSIARFLSVDPLAPDYPWYTPYQFAGNKPIAFIDLDGLEEYRSSVVRISDNELEVQITRAETIKIVNYSNQEILPGVAEKIASRLDISRFNGQAFTKFVFGFDLETRERIPGTLYDVSIKVAHERMYRYTDNLRTINKNEGILMIVDELGPLTEPGYEGGMTAGQSMSTEGYNRVFLVTAKDFLGLYGSRTVAHEEGHRLGLDGHVHDRPNIMSYEHHDALNVLPEQKQQIGESLFRRLAAYITNRTGYDLGNFVVRYNYGKSAKDDIDETLKELDEDGGSYTKPEYHE